MKRGNALLSIVILSALHTRWSTAQEAKAIFHVTGVETAEAKDWCTTGKCSATRITVEGYTDSVEYVLDCIETFANEPSPHATMICDHVHAGNDYEVRIGANYIFFGAGQQPPQTDPVRTAYNIVSERERTKHKEQKPASSFRGKS